MISKIHEPLTTSEHKRGGPDASAPGPPPDTTRHWSSTHLVREVHNTTEQISEFISPTAILRPTDHQIIGDSAATPKTLTAEPEADDSRSRMRRPWESPHAG